MKQKPKRNENIKFNLEMKNTNLSLLTEISNLIFSKNEKQIEKEEK